MHQVQSQADLHNCAWFGKKNVTLSLRQSFLGYSKLPQCIFEIEDGDLRYNLALITMEGSLM